ncbi:MAG: hypothetical protein ACJ8F3_05520 [Xanthobacteraceae bacterium]
MTGSFLAAVLEMITAPAHVLGIVALGLLAGPCSGRWHASVVAPFTIGMVPGLAAVAAGFSQSSAGDVLLAIAGVTAALVIVGKPLPFFVSSALAFTGGMALGLDIAPQAISIRIAIATMIVAAVVVVLGFAAFASLAAHTTRDWQRIGVRIVASWIAATVVLVLALRFARGQLL